jgi:xanthine dehydrogenase accessory factor
VADGMEETPQGRFFLTVYVPSPRLVITGAVHISQTLALSGNARLRRDDR